jgi:hypothetical protein
MFYKLIHQIHIKHRQHKNNTHKNKRVELDPTKDDASSNDGCISHACVLPSFLPYMPCPKLGRC